MNSHPASTDLAPANPHPPLRRIFIGPNGLRAGWRLLLFLLLLVTLIGGFAVIVNGGPKKFLEAQRHASEVKITPFVMAQSEVMTFTFLCLATWIMSRFERRKFGVYGLPLRHPMAKHFGMGWLLGFLAISGTLLAVYLLHGFRIIGLAFHGRAIASTLFGWAIVFVIAGLFEEFLLRGYVQYTLATGIGFWPAALVTSGVFALGHSINPGETFVGLIAVALFGLLHCLFLFKTGTLWYAVGFHAAWDFGQAFYGVHDSGILYQGVFQSATSGPRWLTGGTVGPEASVFTPIVLLLVAVIFLRLQKRETLATFTTAAEDQIL
jgi:membrane protease YdiL (CAAX protease family)